MGVLQATVGDAFEGSFTGLEAGDDGTLGGDCGLTGLATGDDGILGGDLARVGSFLIGLNDGLGTVGSDPVGTLVVGGTDGRSVGGTCAGVGADVSDMGVMETAEGAPTIVGERVDPVLQPLVGFAVGVSHMVVVWSLVINALVAEMDVHRAAIKTGRRVLILKCGR